MSMGSDSTPSVLSYAQAPSVHRICRWYSVLSLLAATLFLAESSGLWRILYYYLSGSTGPELANTFRRVIAHAWFFVLTSAGPAAICVMLARVVLGKSGSRIAFRGVTAVTLGLELIISVWAFSVSGGEVRTLLASSYGSVMLLITWIIIPPFGAAWSQNPTLARSRIIGSALLGLCAVILWARLVPGGRFPVPDDSTWSSALSESLRDSPIHWMSAIIMSVVAVWLLERRVMHFWVWLALVAFVFAGLVPSWQMHYTEVSFTEAIVKYMFATAYLVQWPMVLLLPFVVDAEVDDAPQSGVQTGHG